MPAADMSEGAPRVAPLSHAIPPTPAPATPKRSKAHYLWAVLIARILEVFPLLCPLCGGQMRLIALITEGVQIRKILNHIGVNSEPAQISPARGPPLWDDCDAQSDDGVCTWSPIGTWHRKRHRTLRLISVSTGEGLRRRF